MKRYSIGPGHHHDEVYAKKGEAGITDHGELTGLADDDHLQYLTSARGDARYLGLTDKASDSDRLDNIDSSGFVQTSGNQNIGGEKTFTTIPILPGSNPTSDNQATRKLYVDNAVNNISGLFRPLLPMTKVVDGVAMTVGTTNYYAYNYSVPTIATAIFVRLYAQWGANGWQNVQVGTYGQTDYCVIARAHGNVVSTYLSDQTGIVPLGANSRFWIKCDTTAPTSVNLYIVGYFT